MEGIGAQLHAARARWGLTLREVEEQSNLLAQRCGNPAFKISASWLDRVERENRELSAAKLIVLAYIYGLTPDQMLTLCQGPCESPGQLEQISGPNTTHLLLQGPLEQHARLWLPDTLVTDRPPEDTLLLPSDQITLPSHYRRGVIGRRDRTMEPMIRPGSIVLIDIQKRAIAGRKEWNNEFDRPIYFLFTRAGYVCGFCEIDKKGEWLTLVPHNLSYETNKRWKYRKEIEVVGMVAGVFTRRVA
jgi:transcriptional regulator with XRE-family HTH domain